MLLSAETDPSNVWELGALSVMSGKYSKSILKDEFRVMSLPHRTPVLYVRMNDRPRDDLLTDPTIEFRKDLACARAAAAITEPGS